MGVPDLQDHGAGPKDRRLSSAALRHFTFPLWGGTGAKAAAATIEPYARCNCHDTYTRACMLNGATRLSRGARGPKGPDHTAVRSAVERSGAEARQAGGGAGSGQTTRKEGAGHHSGLVDQTRAMRQ